MLESVARNVLAFALFWLLSFGFVQFGLHQLGGWPATEIGQMLGSAAGVAVAVQLRARLAAYFVAAMVAFSASELIVHLYFGIRAAQGAPTHFAGMGAALLSIALGASIARTNAGKIAGFATPIAGRQRRGGDQPTNEGVSPRCDGTNVTS